MDGVVPISQESGCGMPDGHAVNLLNQLLADTLRHPNLGGAIYIDLGCGKTCVECSAPIFQDAVPQYNQRVANLVIQLSGGSRRTVERGLEITKKLLDDANRFKRQPVPISKLVVGTKCGGSDRWSGVTANPAVGVAADMFVKAGAAVFLPEIPELQGAAMVDLAQRARTRAVGRKLMQALKRYEAYVKMFGEDFRDNPSPGNVKGSEVERRKSQRLDVDCRGPGRIRGVAGRSQGPLRALHTGLRPDLDARAVLEWSAGGAVYNGPRDGHRVCAGTGDEDRLQFAARPHERRYRYRRGDHPGEERDERRSRPQNLPGYARGRVRAKADARRRSRLPHGIQDLGIALAGAVTGAVR
ncbi:MAG: hypothetical protein DMG24_17530 [Acidobacteria bacterium]|nr:MAG: hypothetical protein DMG24_17530 [Acidobacteriota bacterium]